jgi:glycosyltransferase involved in cell wall biosynthesis/SAM-dependent methyltransferase
VRIALFSPLHPQLTGIADYTEDLLPYLARHCIVELFVDGFEPATEAIRRDYAWFDYRRHPEHLARLGLYDAVIYQMGNDPRWHAGIRDMMHRYPGIVVLHEVSFQHFFRAMANIRKDLSIYLDEIEACHGVEARTAAEGALRDGRPNPLDSLAFPLNRRILADAQGFIVHSDWARRYLERLRPDVPIAHVDQLAGRLAAGARARPQARPGRPIRIGTFGQVTEHKGIAKTLRVLGSLPDRLDYRYVIAGSVSEFYDVAAIVRGAGLDARVIVTGHLPIEEFDRRIDETDIAINLREGTIGETSASLCRILAAGVPTIVTNAGWYADLPDDCVVKVDADDTSETVLRAFLERLMQDAPLRERIGANARRYMIERHTPERAAAGYVAFVREVTGRRLYSRMVGQVAAQTALVHDSNDDLFRGVARAVAALASSAADGSSADPAPARGGRLQPVSDLDYQRGAIDYLSRLPAYERDYLLTKPFYNLAFPRPKRSGDGIDPETHRHFCDFANIALALRLPAGSRLLDVGCGSGWLSEYFARLGYEVTGIDVSPALIEMSRDRVARVPYGVDALTPLRCRFLVHGVDRGSLDERFDAIVCYDSLHHVQDEHAAIRNLVAMLEPNGLVMILEGDRPAVDSAGERELVEVMQRYQTLESPFDPEYLRELLRTNGLSIVGDFVPVNGLFDRSMIRNDAVPASSSGTNYILAKLCTRPVSGTTGDAAGVRALRARWELAGTWPGITAPGGELGATVTVWNEGDSIWLADWPERLGVVTLGVTVRDARGGVIDRTHGHTRLPRSLGPGERADLTFQHRAPDAPGAYTLELDLVATNMCWFSERGSEPFVLTFEV